MLMLASARYLGDTQSTFFTGDIRAGTITYSKPDFENGPPQWHAHENAHLSFFISGGTTEARKEYTTRRLPGQWAFYHAGEPHLNTGTLFPSKNFNVEIGPAFLAEYGVADSSVYQHILSNQQARIAVLRLYRELRREDRNQTAVHLMLLDLLLEEKKPPAHFPAWAKKVKEYLQDNWDETASLQTLSAAAGVHPVTISKHFRHYFHYGLGEYQRQLKVEKAIELIRSSSQPLEDIGFTCGFAEKSHFTRVFKEQTGFLPGEYRKL